MRSLLNYLPPVVVIGVLVIALIDAQTERGRNTAPEYHQRISEVADEIPYLIEDQELGGRWVGEPVPVPYEAIEILRPNVIQSVRFFHEVGGVRDGRTFGIMLVHCRDARELIGHYPPICYPSQGWEMIDAEPLDWQTIGTLEPVGTQYDMMMASFESFSRQSVGNTMVIPQLGFARDMEPLREAGEDLRRRFLGAAQVQFIFDSNGTPQSERERLGRLVLEHYAPLLKLVAEGPGQVDGEVVER